MARGSLLSAKEAAMGPHVRWIPLFACVCMLSGGAVDVTSEQGRGTSPRTVRAAGTPPDGTPTKQVKDKKAKNDKNDKARKEDKDLKRKGKPPAGEARPGRNDDDPRLVRWDVNQDGMLSRAEWKASTQLFDRLDLNRDDVLTPAELAERP
jgi:hypothetical protein